MNYDFLELIKYNFKSIDIEVTDENKKLIKEKIEYEELLPTDEEIKEYVNKSDIFIDNLRETWDEYIDYMDDEVRDKTLNDDKIIYKAFENGKFDIPINIILKELIKENKLKNILNEIINNRKINYDTYIEKLNIEKDNNLQEMLQNSLTSFKIDTFNDNTNFTNFKFPIYDNWCSVLSYDEVKNNLENIINIIKEFIINKKNRFNNRKKIIDIVRIIKFNSASLPPNTFDRTVNILDMTKVYNFGNELVKSSLITNSLLEWKVNIPYEYNSLSNIIDKNIYEIVAKDLENWNSLNKMKRI